MKILKRAKQKNVVLDLMYYTERELEKLAEQEIIFWIDHEKHYTEEWITSKIPLYKSASKIEWRLSLDDMKEIKVIVDKEDGMYQNVAVAHDGTVYHITL